MKSGVIPAVLLVTVLAVLAPFAQGLQCYACKSKNLPPDFPLGQGASEHESCMKGVPGLPDTFVQNCTAENAPDVKDANGNPGLGDRWKGDFACGVSVLMVADTDIAGRGCMRSEPAPPEAHNTVQCQSLKIGPLNVIFCACADDKCNKDEPKVPEPAEGSTPTTVAAGARGLAPSLISSALGALFFFKAGF